jgi:hypothetical protein
MDPISGEYADQDGSSSKRPQRNLVLVGVRYVLPAVVSLGSETDLEGGASILSAGLAIYFVNWLFRMGAAGDIEREAEAAAREYYDRHGRWPT